jgi:hypothetical protein
MVDPGKSPRRAIDVDCPRLETEPVSAGKECRKRVRNPYHVRFGKRNRDSDLSAPAPCHDPDPYDQQERTGRDVRRGGGHAGCGIPVVVDTRAHERQVGPHPVSYGRFDGGGAVGITDFLVLLANWD